MFRLGANLQEPIHDDGAQIAAAVAARQRHVRVCLSLVGAATGLYVAFATPNGIVYVGGFVGMAALYKMWTAVMQIGRRASAKEYEIINHEQS